jgi:hypothetical protein
MKYLIIASCFFFTAYLSHNDVMELIPQMKDTCHQSYTVDSGPLEEACGKLTDRIEENNKLEVISDNKGNFWVESKE